MGVGGSFYFCSVSFALAEICKPRLRLASEFCFCSSYDSFDKDFSRLRGAFSGFFGVGVSKDISVLFLLNGDVMNRPFGKFDGGTLPPAKVSE